MPRKETVEIYQFDELSEPAKKVAIEWYRNAMSGTDDVSDEIKEDSEQLLMAELPWAPREDIRFRLAYSQGDGVAFYGPVNMKLFAASHPEFKDLAGSEVECDIRIEKARNLHLYNHEGTMTPEVISVYDPSSSRDYSKLGHLAMQAAEVIKTEIKEMSVKLRENGYKIMLYLNSDENIIENIKANEYEFTVDGKRW